MATPEDHSYEMASAYDVKKPLNSANVPSESDQRATMDKQAALAENARDQMKASVEKATKAQVLGNNEQSQNKEVALGILDKQFSSIDAGAGNKMPEGAAAPVVKEALAAATQLGAQPQNVEKNLEKVFSSLPKGLKDFFKGIFGLFMDLAKNNTPDKQVKLDNIKDEGQKILDKYGAITRNEGGKDIVEFGRETKIQSVHTNPNATNTSSKEGIDAASKKSGKPVEVTGSKITLDQAKIATVDTTEKDGVITMTVKNKDGSSDTYTVTGAKEARQKVGSADGGTWNVETDSRIPGTRGGY